MMIESLQRNDLEETQYYTNVGHMTENGRLLLNLSNTLHKRPAAKCIEVHFCLEKKKRVEKLGLKK